MARDKRDMGCPVCDYVLPVIGKGSKTYCAYCNTKVWRDDSWVIRTESILKPEMQLLSPPYTGYYTEKMELNLLAIFDSFKSVFKSNGIAYKYSGITCIRCYTECIPLEENETTVCTNCSLRFIRENNAIIMWDINIPAKDGLPPIKQPEDVRVVKEVKTRKLIL